MTYFFRGEKKKSSLANTRLTSRGFFNSIYIKAEALLNPYCCAYAPSGRG